MRLRRSVILFFTLVIIGVFAAPSLWNFYLWAGFPDSSVERVQFLQTKYGTGRECSSSHIGAVPPSANDVKACFASASQERVFLDDERAGWESITITYRCDGNGFSGEIVYMFYSTNERYMCSYKTAENWEDIPQYQTGDIAGFSPEPSHLTKLLIRIFR
tara:strand:- start:299 stop:778 length:480 start_codon:yes stop_codon:yes gene_type:complete